MKLFKPFIFFSLLMLSQSGKSSATNESITTGSFIINMGVTPQTNANGLIPYGMLYDLIHNYNVPIVWSINPAKVKDGADFTYNAVNYCGGTFIVEEEYITAAVTGRITYWQGQGVQGVYTTSAISVPLYMILTNFPFVMISNLSGSQNILTSYYTEAGIPATGYTMGTPSDLNSCYDIFTDAHDSPNWVKYQYLYNFLTVQKGWVWVECLTVSELEAVTNPASPFTQLNFLTSNGLQCHNPGACGTIAESHTTNASSPITYHHPTDAVMQFMSTCDGANANGNERWFSPLTTGQWNANTRRGVTDNHGAVPREGALIAYGPAYDNAANGWIMYEGGHQLDAAGTTAENVSAIRAYFNFILLAGDNFKLTVTLSVPSSSSPGNHYPVSATVSGGSPAYSYQWLSSQGGTFASPNSASTTYTAPSPSVDGIDIVRCLVTDACGRSTIQFARVSNLANSPLPIVLHQLSATPEKEDVRISWTTDSEIDNDYFTLFRSKDGSDFKVINNIRASGNSTSVRDYCVIDQDPISGMSYYRLSQVDYDGKEMFFKPVPVNWETMNIEILGVEKINPNPFIKELTIDYFSKTAQKVHLEVLNTSGTKVFERWSDAKENNNSLKIDDFTGKENIYFIFLSCEEWRTKGYKLIRQ